MAVKVYIVYALSIPFLLSLFALILFSFNNLFFVLCFVYLVFPCMMLNMEVCSLGLFYLDSLIGS